MPERKHYSEEFKRDALRLLETSGQGVAEIERELGITHGLLRKWRQRYQVDAHGETLTLSDIEQLKADVRRLQRENAVLREEREILKKTVSIFSKGSRR